MARRRPARPLAPPARLLIASVLCALPLLGSVQACGADDAGAPRIVASSVRVPFHYSTCNRVRRIPEDKFVVFENREAALAAGHEPCKLCQP